VAANQFRWAVLQTGQLPVTFDGQRIAGLEHRPTSILIWPAGQLPEKANTILTDPYFTFSGYRSANQALRSLGISFDTLDRAFVTHPHYDHMPSVPGRDLPDFRLFAPGAEAIFDGISAVHCPGHSPVLRALVFTAPSDGQVWVVGDAILDADWLRNWHYYWYNGYSPAEVVQTWRTVARIIAQADIIIPGHGAPIPVDKTLVDGLKAAFPHAEYASGCPDVLDLLEQRQF
jgi:glyoxylase-like metal-dependent hydrolase (beta-lactamase superfamily II)